MRVRIRCASSKTKSCANSVCGNSGWATHFQRGDDGGQRAAQLVGGVADEAALSGLPRFDAFEHLVHRDRKCRNLIPMQRHRYATRQIVAADVGDLSPIASTDRSERRTNTSWRPPPAHHERHRCRQQQAQIPDREFTAALPAATNTV